MDRKFAGTRILTFQEAIDLVRGKAGLYPELKDPEFYRQRGVDPVKLFADVVKKNRLEADPKTPLILQSFDDATLKAAAVALPTVPRVFLVSPPDAGRIDAPDKLKEIAAWATGIGPNKAILEKTPDIVAWAHAAKLTVTPWTFRASQHRQVPVGAGGDEALPLHARGRRALHRQPRPVPADEVARRGHVPFPPIGGNGRCPRVYFAGKRLPDEQVVEPAAEHAAHERAHDRHPPPVVAGAEDLAPPPGQVGEHARPEVAGRVDRVARSSTPNAMPIPTTSRPTITGASPAGAGALRCP